MAADIIQAPAPATLAVSGVVKRYDGLLALAGATLSVAAGDLVTILGPSGSGKTTLLKVIAGFEPPDEGKIVLDGADITDMSPSARNIGMVFQNYALFPHMTVAANIAFPLKMRGWSRAAIAERVDWALRLVELPDHGSRRPPQLSGGQQQRIALARAVVFNPKLLLLDEPFGALDRKLRETMQLEVKRLQRKLGVTTIFITHDQEEALIMSDQVAVMRSGGIQQIGRPRDIYVRPDSRFVADFIGESNLFRGRVAAVQDGAVTVMLADGVSVLTSAAAGCCPGDQVNVIVRPEAPIQTANGVRPDNVLRAKVIEAIYLGSAVKYRLAVTKDLEMVVRWPATAREAPLAAGTDIELGWSAQDTHLLPER